MATPIIQLTDGALTSVEEVGREPAVDVAEIVSGRATEAELIEECLSGVEDAQRKSDWREYVDGIVAAAERVTKLLTAQDGRCEIGKGDYDGDEWGAPMNVTIPGLGTIGAWHGVREQHRGTARAAHAGYDERMADTDLDQEWGSGLDSENSTLLHQEAIEDLVRNLVGRLKPRIADLARPAIYAAADAAKREAREEEAEADARYARART